MKSEEEEDHKTNSIQKIPEIDLKIKKKRKKERQAIFYNRTVD